MSKNREKTYTAETIDVTFDPARCIHSENCVRTLPAVFDVGRRPWIQPDKASAEAVARAVTFCPTGALRYRSESVPPEPVPPENTLRVAAGGPVYVRGDLLLKDHDGEPLARETRLALCRCGASGTKPLCNGAHTDLEDLNLPGSLGDSGLRDDGSAETTLTLQPKRNGPMIVTGKLTLLSENGNTTLSGTRTALCRCGRSSNKPFCDGSHAREGWRE